MTSPTEAARAAYLDHWSDDLDDNEYRVIGEAYFKVKLAEMLGGQETLERIARAIFAGRDGEWNYNRYRRDPRIAEAYRKDAQAAIRALVGRE